MEKMMLFGLLMTLYIINCLLLVLVVLIQQGKGGLGISYGNIGGGQIFGGSGGADELQKTTWILGAIFMFGSLALAIFRSHQASTATHLRQPTRQVQMPTLPTSETE
jgi:preprotein translocase subunit SecG